MTEKIQPKHKARNGAFSVAVFENTGKTAEGKEFKYESIVLQRSYNKGTQEAPEWKHEVINFRKNDVEKMKSLLDNVYNKLSVTEE